MAGQLAEDKKYRTSQYLKEQEVADLFSIPVSTLRDWRHRRVGPTYIKIGRHVRYRPSDIEQFVNSRTIKILA